MTWAISELSRRASCALWLSIAALGSALAQGLSGDVVVPHLSVDAKTFSGMTRCLQCDPADARELGMEPTGLAPRFALNAGCRTIDDGWAIDYSEKRGKPSYHGGIDIPAPKGTPILAVADGELVAVNDDLENPEGLKVYLRHAPADTGHPYWIYTEYAHLVELPAWKIGQRLRLGDVVGKTGNSGLSGKEVRVRNTGTARVGGSKGSGMNARRDAVHFAVLYSEDPRFAVWHGRLIPHAGRWMDPVALYRDKPPFESAKLRELSVPEKSVPVPYRNSDGQTVPTGSKLIWPYACGGR